MIEKTFPITETLLNNGLVTTQRFLELLHKESENLARHADASTLSTIATLKKDMVGQLELFSNHLGQVLATEKLTADHQGVQQYLNKAQSVGIDIRDTRYSWSTITALLNKCRALNDQNGASIALLSRHTDRALQILKGKTPQTGTYGPDGTTRNELFSRTIVSV